MDDGGKVYTIGPSDAFLKHERRPVVFTRRELADRFASSRTIPLTVHEIRALDLSATIRKLHGSGLDLCMVHDYDPDDSKFRSVTLHARSGIMDSVHFLERCMERDASAADTIADLSAASTELRAELAGLRLLPKPRRKPAVARCAANSAKSTAQSMSTSMSNIVSVSFRFWYSLVLYAIVYLLEDDLM